MIHIGLLVLQEYENELKFFITHRHLSQIRQQDCHNTLKNNNF